MNARRGGKGDALARRPGRDGGGGAALAWALAASGDRARLLVPVATRFEAGHWAAAGLAVLTGVGNVGAIGAVPIARSPWGARLAAKLALAIVLLAFGACRTALVARLAATPGAPLPRRAARTLRAACAATTVLLGAGVAVAVRPAHA